MTAALGVLGLILAPSEAPLLWDGMLDQTLPAIIVTMLIGLATAAALWWKYYPLARVLIILTTAGLLGTWGLSQMPYLIPPDVTIERAAVSPVMITFLLVATVIGMMIVIPSLWFLFHVFKSRRYADIHTHP
jgi:cytochrome d ubiquinol oxidase subunit II